MVRRAFADRVSWLNPFTAATAAATAAGRAKIRVQVGEPVDSLMATRYVAATAPVPVYSPDVVTAVASFDHAVKLPVYAPHGELYSPTHRPQHTCLIGNPPPQLLLSRWMEGGLKHGGLLEELLALLVGVEPVSSGTS